MGKPTVLINVLISKPNFISISAVFTTKKAFNGTLQELPPVVGLKLVVGQDWVSLSSNHLQRRYAEMYREEMQTISQ